MAASAVMATTFWVLGHLLLAPYLMSSSPRLDRILALSALVGTGLLMLGALAWITGMARRLRR
jgi:hypothetical protein